MLKVVTFMKQVARGLQIEGNFGTAHVYRSSHCLLWERGFHLL